MLNGLGLAPSLSKSVFAYTHVLGNKCAKYAFNAELMQSRHWQILCGQILNRIGQIRQLLITHFFLACRLTIKNNVKKNTVGIFTPINLSFSKYQNMNLFTIKNLNAKNKNMIFV